LIKRYTLPAMGNVWEDQFKLNTWLQIELLACEARAEMGEIPKEDVELIRQKAKFDIGRMSEIEETTRHDVIAFLTNVAEYLGPESRHIHYGMTSSDILDTTLSVQMKTAGALLLNRLNELQSELKIRAIEHKYTVCVGRSHGMHAEPTTMGLKFALWYEEIKRNITRLQSPIHTISPAPISTQVIQRDRHAEFITTLAIIGATLEKIATEIRHLQRTEVQEAEEYFSKGQKGSSAMPHKRNPIISERVAGLARILRGNSLAAIENVALWHERDISHSSVERVIIPDSCIALDYMLDLMTKLIKNLIIYPDNMIKNLNLTRGLIFSQAALLKLIDKGVVRDDAYRIIQNMSMDVWKDTDKSLREELIKNKEVRNYLTEEEINNIFTNDHLIKNVDFIYSRTIDETKQTE